MLGPALTMSIGRCRMINNRIGDIGDQAGQEYGFSVRQLLRGLSKLTAMLARSL